jgi:protein SCO1/2
MRLFFALLSASLLLAGCARGAEYELRGQVLAVDRARNELTIKHGDIRGFMPGMTMPFKVKDATLLEGRTPGDLVTATLVVRDNSAYLSSVTVTGHAPLAEAPPERRMNILEPGAAVPDVKLTDDSGASRSLSEWRGRVVAVTFIYTRCPLPDFCPRMDQNFAAVQRAVLADPQLRDRVSLLSVSFDPQFDTPQVLAAHARRAGADPRVWRFVTADRSTVEAFAGEFGVAVFREGTGAEGITHNLRTGIIKPDGTLATILNGTDWTPAALIDAARQAGE